MEDLVLTTRLALIKRNLEQVARILDDAEGRDEELSRLKDHLLEAEGIMPRTGHVKDQLGYAEITLSSAKETLAHLEEIADEEVSKKDVSQKICQKVSEATGKIVEIEENLAQAKNEIKHINDRIGACKKDFKKVLSRRIKLHGQDVHEYLKDVQKNLKEEADEQIKEVNKIARDIPDAKTPKDLTPAWEEYTKKVFNPSKSLFAEYVDFLRGLALRDTGLDLGICRRADRLLSTITSSPLTIPARREAMMTVAQIIRVGFPEWTIWAVPMLAHDVGHIVAEREAKKSAERKTKDLFKRHPPSQTAPRRYLVNCLADAFATYTMGPAYACAALLLRFNPRLSGGKYSDAGRAYVILEMLDRAGGSFAASFREIHQLLQDQWSAALKQVGASPLPKSRRQTLDKWIDDFACFLPEKALAYDADSWSRAQTCAGLLLTGKIKVDQIPPTTDLRDVPNAAWKCRVDNPQQADRIREAAEDLWELVHQKTKRKGPKGNIPRTRP